jgi:hypothetical protein
MYDLDYMLQREVAYRDTVNATKRQFQGSYRYSEITPRPPCASRQRAFDFKASKGQGLVASSWKILRRQLRRNHGKKANCGKGCAQ